MKVQTDPGPLYTHATEAFYAAAEDVRLYVMTATAPVRSGRYRDSIKVWKRKRASGPTARIGSRLPYSGILERGGGPHAGWKHQGPHVQRANAPRPLRRAAEKFPAFYERRLASTPVFASAIVGPEFGDPDVGPQFLDLAGL